MFRQFWGLSAWKTFHPGESAEANFAIDVNHLETPIVAGSTNEVEFIEIAGVKIWPK
jgi:hypothetical protein